MIRRRLSTILTSIALSMLLVIPLRAQSQTGQPDGTWISINGTVESVSPAAFTFDYGDGLMTIKTDEWDTTPEGFQVAEGDMVSVFGAIDDNFYKESTIDASGVFVESRGTYYFSSTAGEKDTFISIATPLAESTTIFQGTVTSVGFDEFTLDTDETMLTVEIDEMPYNPLDDEGFQKIEAGDRVSVVGEFRPDIFEGREFDARWVTTIVDASGSEYSILD
jgi:uncharacterized protein YdeI (BOF family)